MTLDQFLERLRQTPRDWFIDAAGDIRRPGDQCPISALGGDRAAEYERVAERLGISSELAENVVDAADNFSSDMDLRRRLLGACGLTERAE